MITAIVKIENSTRRPGRKGFVPKSRDCHGIVKGNVRRYRVTGNDWKAIRTAVADSDSTGRNTMGYSNVGPETVERWSQDERKTTETSVVPVARLSDIQREMAAIVEKRIGGIL